MGLSVTVLGCDGSYAATGGACSGYLVRTASTSVWVDCGPGTLANVQRHLPLGELDAVVVSHAHPDHWVELPVLHSALRWFLGREDLPVHGTAETHDRLLGARGGEEIAPTFEWRTITDRSAFAVGDMRFTCSLTDHPVETLAMRIDHAAADEPRGQVSIGYSADTGPGWSLSELGPDLDIAVCEATLPAGDASGAPHLTTTQAGTMAREAGARRLVITHLAPGRDPDAARAEAEQAFGAEVEMATVGARFDA